MSGTKIDQLVGRVAHWRRTRALARVRSDLERRGLSVADMTDDELEVAVQAGRDALKQAHTRGGDTTAAFVMVIRKRERI
jgi:hypothetical protein